MRECSSLSRAGGWVCPEHLLGKQWTRTAAGEGRHSQEFIKAAKILVRISFQANGYMAPCPWAVMGGERDYSPRAAVANLSDNPALGGLFQEWVLHLLRR